MQIAYTDLRDFRLRAGGEPEGTVDDVYFDDAEWIVRYVVGGVGFWIFGRQCLLGPELLATPDVAKRELPVGLTPEELRETAPPAGADRPVSAQETGALAREAMVWPPRMLGAVGAEYTPYLAERQIREETLREGGGMPEEPGDPHLRSMREVTGYAVAARDGEAGHVGDFLIDPEAWRVTALVVDTGGWLPGRHVVVGAGHAAEVDWTARRITLRDRRADIEASPEIEKIGDLVEPDRERLLHRISLPGV